MFVLAAAGIMAATLTHGLVDNAYFLPDLAVLFWTTCALLDFARRERTA